MEPAELGFGTTLVAAHHEVLDEVRAVLEEQGFGVITEIDVAATMRAKLGLEMPPYVILGACNPALAHRVLQSDPELGLLLPCTVIVYQTTEGTRVSVVDPSNMASTAAGNQAVQEIAREARARLLRVVDRLNNRPRRKENTP